MLRGGRRIAGHGNRQGPGNAYPGLAAAVATRLLRGRSHLCSPRGSAAAIAPASQAIEGRRQLDAKPPAIQDPVHGIGILQPLASAAWRDPQTSRQAPTVARPPVPDLLE